MFTFMITTPQLKSLSTQQAHTQNCIHHHIPNSKSSYTIHMINSN